EPKIELWICSGLTGPGNWAQPYYLSGLPAEILHAGSFPGTEKSCILFFARRLISIGSLLTGEI
ncbi:MAG: hypothetical protein ACLQDI_16585, partial [Syntrophobacteraceae bacterium]